MRESLHVVGSRPAGPAAGMLFGVIAGSLVFAALVNDLLLGIAVAGIAAALLACMLWAVPEWHRFGVGMLVGTIVAAGALTVAFYAGGSLGWW